jgi:hypothetical protein
MTPTELKSMSANAIEYQRALAFISLNPETEEALRAALRRVIEDGQNYLRRDEHHVDFMV